MSNQRITITREYDVTVLEEFELDLDEITDEQLTKVGEYSRGEISVYDISDVLGDFTPDRRGESFTNESEMIIEIED
ncbi:hypothetical protein [Brevibacterium album]|uniref:hypothetical protein n=1 Tax=Brevibacterium album TaxID=417948 RepID=UPI000491888A|nr:hypothetical protein [Brevibacterium album]